MAAEAPPSKNRRMSSITSIFKRKRVDSVFPAIEDSRTENPATGTEHIEYANADPSSLSADTNINTSTSTNTANAANASNTANNAIAIPTAPQTYINPTFTSSTNNYSTPWDPYDYLSTSSIFCSRALDVISPPVPRENFLALQRQRFRYARILASRYRRSEPYPRPPTCPCAVASQPVAQDTTTAAEGVAEETQDTTVAPLETTVVRTRERRARQRRDTSTARIFRSLFQSSTYESDGEVDAASPWLTRAVPGRRAQRQRRKGRNASTTYSGFATQEFVSRSLSRRGSPPRYEVLFPEELEMEGQQRAVDELPVLTRCPERSLPRAMAEGAGVVLTRETAVAEFSMLMRCSGRSSEMLDSAMVDGDGAETAILVGGAYGVLATSTPDSVGSDVTVTRANVGRIGTTKGKIRIGTYVRCPNDVGFSTPPSGGYWSHTPPRLSLFEYEDDSEEEDDDDYEPVFGSDDDDVEDGDTEEDKDDERLSDDEAVSPRNRSSFVCLRRHPRSPYPPRAPPRKSAKEVAAQFEQGRQRTAAAELHQQLTAELCSQIVMGRIRSSQLSFSAQVRRLSEQSGDLMRGAMGRLMEAYADGWGADDSARDVEASRRALLGSGFF